ncbi:hypothetical protein ABIB00_003205, partial [Bradyrhizobium sp. LB14.3]|uniref:hypothetical protein n=1 Tax=Bradyrhizobium sp. LB14.3 TaxID=3156328 RepID=UPI0033982FA6
AVGTKSWQQSNKKRNIRLDTPNPHVSNPDCLRGKISGLLRFARNDEQTKTPERFSTPASCWFKR